MTLQPEFAFKSNTRKPSAERARADADLLTDVLRKRPDLQRRPAETLALVMGWNDRRLRAAAEASRGEILSAPGCTGYRLAESTPVQDYYDTERARYRSQIRLMESRLCEMDRAVHSGKCGEKCVEKCGSALVR